MLKQFLKDYFSFNKRERNGILVLLCIIVLLIVFIGFSEHFVNKPDVDLAAVEVEIDQFLAAQRQNEKGNYPDNSFYEDTGTTKQYFNSSEDGYVQKTNKKEIKTNSLFYFDPNNLNDEKWEQLGFKPWQVNAIKKYRLKAGKFATKADFKKLRIITAEQYRRLEPYIMLPENNPGLKWENSDTSIEEIVPVSAVRTESKKTNTVTIIELNTATTNQLTKLKGIGDVYSRRIIKYRNLLGGFTHKKQLLEVYGMDSTYAFIEDMVEVNPNKLEKININKCTVNQLKTHPYISWNVANAIVNYRDQHGNYTRVGDIKNTDLISDELYNKVVPYLSID